MSSQFHPVRRAKAPPFQNKTGYLGSANRTPPRGIAPPDAMLQSDIFDRAGMSSKRAGCTDPAAKGEGGVIQFYVSEAGLAQEVFFLGRRKQ